MLKGLLVLLVVGGPLVIIPSESALKQILESLLTLFAHCEIQKNQTELIMYEELVHVKFGLVLHLGQDVQLMVHIRLSVLVLLHHWLRA